MATKFLSDELTADQLAGRRLIREARAAAKLDHPNICSVYEVAERDGQTFIVMQYVEGETLAEKIKREPMEFREVIDVAAQVQTRLQKPTRKGSFVETSSRQNIMLTGRAGLRVDVLAQQ